ncbi:MerR family transcriptional regulator [Kangiella sediminilitoris]|uniref:Transcriptional regulator, MerR family n=1 Tax=Kangiella sediminilitoris TaxID=1144748 RepID=A0A1B3BB57_9GAMM|nr:MerR family DNA-binding transcriptional regulator [Kangiella sediminilitoris]AOE50004.1 Transcriptional regulator, MerR family [Kangiella sediminilitoris]
MNEEKTEYSISDLAKEFGITSRSIRHYEDENLITPSRRGVHRIYNNRDRVRLQLILRGKRLGFSLAEIKEIIDLYGMEGEQKQTERLLELISSRRDSLNQQLRDIKYLLKEFDVLEAKLIANR